MPFAVIQIKPLMPGQIIEFTGSEGLWLWKVEIRVSISVGIDDGRARSHLLDEITLSTTSEVLPKLQPGCPGDILEFDISRNWHRNRGHGGRLPLVYGRPTAAQQA